jgi:hypothetical protein
MNETDYDTPFDPTVIYEVDGDRYAMGWDDGEQRASIMLNKDGASTFEHDELPDDATIIDRDL